MFVAGNQPSLQRAVFDAIYQQGPRERDYTDLDPAHSRIVRCSIRGGRRQGH
jgi:hypothetical protein